MARGEREVNRALAGDYQALFDRLDLLVLLQAPGFEHVQAWRTLQERKLGARLAAEGRPGAVMDDAAIARFIMHYERLTRWILRGDARAGGRGGAARRRPRGGGNARRLTAWPEVSRLAVKPLAVSGGDHPLHLGHDLAQVDGLGQDLGALRARGRRRRAPRRRSR